MTDNTKKPTIVVPPLPEPLSPHRLHSPEVRRAHQAKVETHYAAKREAERQAAQEAEAARAYANRILDDDAYHELKVKEWNEQQAKQLQREADKYAEEQRRKEALAASPDIATVFTANNVAQFLLDLQSWIRRSYEVDLNGPLLLSGNLCHVTLKAPAKKKAKATETEAAA